MDPTTTTTNADGDDDNSAISPSINDEPGFRSTKDMVWAKAYPYTWWPGSIQRKSRGKLLVSFFESNRTLWFREREISSFETDFQVMMLKKAGSRLQPAIECALSEFSRRLVVEMSCGCQRKEGELGSERREGFRSVEVLDFIKGVAVCGSYEEVESLRVRRAAAEVEVFRQYAYAKRDRVNEETMRVSEMVGDSEGNKMSTSFKDEITCSMTKELEVKDEKEQEDDDELEKELENHKEYVEQVKSDTAIRKHNIKESLKQQHPVEVSQVIGHQAFHPVEALAFIHRMAVSSWANCVDTDSVTKSAALVNTFRRHAFIKHDWIYQESMRLAESTNDLEANMNGVVFEDKQTCKVVQKGKISEDENNQKLAVKQVKYDLLIDKKTIENHLRHIVKDLYCLALDPFLRAKGHGVKNFEATRQKILRYRELVYLKAINRPLLLEHTPVDDCVAETSKAQKLLKVNSTTNLGNVSVNVPVVVNVGAVNKFRTRKLQLLSNAASQHNKKAKVEDTRLCCNTSNDGDTAKSVDRDVELFRDTASNNGKCESNRRQKTKDIKVGSSVSDVMESVNVINAKRDIHGRKGESESNKTKKLYTANVCSISNVESGDVGHMLCNTPDSNCVNKRQKTEKAKEYSRSNAECSNVVDQLRDTSKCNNDFQSNKRQKISTSDPAVSCSQGGSTKTLHVDQSACATDDCHESKISPDVPKDHFHSKTCNEAGIDGRTVDMKVDSGLHTVLSTLPSETMSEEIIGTESEGDVADLCNKEPNIGMVSVGSSKGNQRSSETTINISVKTHQTKTLQPMYGLPSSPLSAKSPTPTGAQVQSSKSRTGSESPATLHMKFPKDFKLPSKDELVKRFRPFGPIDSLKSKVFFYTGSAQVVFQRYLDAEAACHYAKRKKIFLGGVNVRFWLDQREHSKRGASNISAPVSLPTTGSSILDVKSCLKISSPQKTKSGRKKLHVKFPSASQDHPSYTVGTTHEVLMQSDSVKCSKEVAPDISTQMFALLEKCNEIVTKVKDNLGLQSFYSVFSRSYCYPEFDDR